jgi:hypothetical protein
MNSYERYNKTDEIVSKFKNGEKLFHTSPLFNTVVQQMVDGMTIYEAMEAVISISELNIKAFEQYVLRIPPIKSH